jgi:bifunctional oligoribonuclease and PAP phosphatase NrnA
MCGTGPGRTMTAGEQKRSVRVAERVRAELMDVLLRGEVRDPEARDVFVSEVRVTDDLSQARVYVRLLDPDAGSKRRERAVRAMEKASGFLRRRIAARMEIKRVPELRFHWDEVVDEAARIEGLLAEVREEPLPEGREGALELVRRGSRFMVACHRRPDADALGSALGFAQVLRALGKEAVVFVPEAVSESLRFLPGVDALTAALDAGERFDATFIMDTAAAQLLPEGFPETGVTGPVVVVDHHAAHDDFGDVVVRDVFASATAEVVIDLAEGLGVTDLSADASAPLYAALVADTGGFRYPGTRHATLRLGARLVEAGADPWSTAYHLFEDWTWSRMALLRAVLDTMALHLDARLATLRVTRGMLDETGANDDMVEGLVNYGRMLRGVEVAALIWEQDRGSDGKPRTKVSLRSQGTVDVSAIASALGGGGHRGAAGALVSEDLDAAQERIVELAAGLLAP